MNIKKLIAGAAISAAAFSSFAVPAFASNAGDGSDYGTMPGYTIANDNTVCAGHGAFDAFGKDASLGTETVHATFLGSYPGPGTDGTQTGLNNSLLCGNRQGNL